MISSLPAYRQVVRGYYRYLDDWMGRFIQLLDPNTVIVVLSDHGVDLIPFAPVRSGEHKDAPPGVLILKGPNVLEGICLLPASLYDVLPTLMALLRLPVARDWEGRVLEEAFCPDFLEAHPIERLDTYETEGWRRAEDASIPESIKEQLLKEYKALGYVN